MPEPGTGSDASRALPDGIDPDLWFHSETCGGRDYLFDAQWHTHPGRMGAYCPHREWAYYRISVTELPKDLPVTTMYWVRGFLAGNLPRQPDADDDSVEMRRWRAKAEAFAHVGYWEYDDEV